MQTRPNTGKPPSAAGVARQPGEAISDFFVRRNEALVSALAEIAYEWNVRTDEVLWEGDFTRILGYSPDEIGSDTASWTSRIHPDDLSKVMADVERAVAAKRTVDLEYRLRHRDGHYLWMHDRGVATLNEAGELDHMIGVLRDISSRKQDELRIHQLNRTHAVLSDINQLIVRERDPQAILDNACRTAVDKGGFKLAWVGMLDPATRKLRLAAHAGAALDLTETLRCIERHFAHCGFAQRALETGKHAICADITTDPETESFREDALAHGFRSLISLPLITEGDHIGVLTLYSNELGPFDQHETGLLDELAYDISFALQVQRRELEHRKLEGQLRQAQKMDALGRLAGGIAHDFNNLLAAISGYTSLIALQIAAGDSTQKSLNEIKAATGRAADLTRRILEFSRPQDDHRRSIELGPVAMEAVELLRTTLPASTEIRTVFAPDLPLVTADPSQVHQMLINLGTNADHAMRGRSGVLEIRADVANVSVETAALSASLREGRYVRVSVRDTGRGMDADTLEHIFEPFFTTKAPSEGTGLGLSIVHGIMRSHGGTVTVYSQAGAGTTFNLYFPALESRETQAEAFVTTVARGHGEHILYVDDEPGLAFVAARILEYLGYKVTSCTHADEALRVYSDPESKVDAVMTDLGMPGMNGIELAIALHKQKADLPIVLITGYLSPQDGERAREAGIRQIAFKPSTVEELATVLAAALAPKAAESAAQAIET